LKLWSFFLKYYAVYKQILSCLLEIFFRHYRSIYSGNWIEYGVPKIEMFGDFSITSYPAKYMKTLRENVQQRLQYVY
ncbi:hypothetical protein Angca_000868, partial [Angiostrongylus cantonensis]